MHGLVGWTGIVDWARKVLERLPMTYSSAHIEGYLMMIACHYITTCFSETCSFLFSIVIM